MERKRSNAVQGLPILRPVQNIITSLPEAQATRSNELLVKLANIIFVIQVDQVKDEHADKEFGFSVLVDELQKSDSTLMGVLGRCCIQGCDVHLLSPALIESTIIRHFANDEAVPAVFVSARERLMGAPANVVAVFVYADHMKVLRLDGSVQDM